ncbi:MAG: UDP-N-acetylmuramoyl-L-alanine--D-glutamate ligase [Candidatus Binatia bacterium]
MKFRGKTVLVIGLQNTGVSVARFIAGQGGHVRVNDLQRQDALLPQLLSLSDVQPELFLQTEDPGMLAGVDLVVPSPGVPSNSPLLNAARRQGIPIWSEIELAARFISCPIIAVTGTNGKSTTTTLLGKILHRHNERVFVGGNLGTPLLEAAGIRYEVVVAEVSSFQLEWIEQFRPHIGVFLNLSEDHLDRYTSFTAYGLTKRGLLAGQEPTDWAVVNRDDPEVQALADDLPGQRFSFGWSPLSAGVQEGAWIDSGTLIVRHNGKETRYALDRVRLYGRHNLENIMAAVSAATLWGVARKAIAPVLKTFSGLPHRMELVAKKRGVCYFDDSKGTNVGAVVQSLASCAGPVILLAGGVDKGGDYSPLQAQVRAKVKKLIVFGQARDLIRAALGSETDTVVVHTLAEAVQEAAATACDGDTVLLSPACASFDQFRNYAHRGEVFRACVEAL